MLKRRTYCSPRDAAEDCARSVFCRLAFTLLLMLLVPLLAERAFAASVTVRMESLNGAAGSAIQVPVIVEGAKNIGAMHLELAYDPAVLSVESVENGPAGGSAMLEFNTGTAGRVVIGLISLDGIQGDGVLLTVKFKVTGQAGQRSALTLDRCRAWEVKSHFDIVVNTRPGEVRLTTQYLPSFAVLAAIVAVVAIVAIVVIVLLVRRRNTRRKTPAPGFQMADPARGFVPGRLVVTGGGVSTPGIDLPTTGLTIGRAASNQLVLSDTAASAQHAHLGLVQGQWIIQDLNSTNGTYVNDERLTAGRVLRSGDRVRIGQVSLVFVSP